MSAKPETRYVETDKGFIGYQVFGEGSRNLVFITNWLTNIETIWEEPSAERYLRRLGSIGRVVLVDKRGTGISDPHGIGRPQPVEEYVDDFSNVLDEIDIDDAILIGDSEGGTLAIVLAATYPERFPGLMLINSFARLSRADDYPIGAPDSVLDSLAQQWKDSFGHSAEPLRLTAPSMVGDRRFGESWLRQNRLSMPPGVAGEAIEWIRRTDVRSALPAIQARTVILSRRDAILHRAQYSQYLATNIEGAVLKLLEGADTLPFYAGDFNPILDEIEEFVTGERQKVDSNRMLATVMFTDIVGSTAMAAELGDDRWLDLRSHHDRVVQSNLVRFRGRQVKFTGDGVLATFDGPHRAILCALAIQEEMEAVGIDIRAGLHTGEVEHRNGDLGGIAVNIASRVMDKAEAGGVMTSRTVHDLVAGSAVEFKPCGTFELKGVPGSWELFEVVAS